MKRKKTFLLGFLILSLMFIFPFNNLKAGEEIQVKCRNTKVSSDYCWVGGGKIKKSCANSMEFNDCPTAATLPSEP